MSEVRFWPTRNLNVIRNVLSEENILHWLIDEKKVNEVHSYSLNRKNLSDDDLVIYEVRYGVKLMGLVIFTIKDNTAKIDVVFLKWARGKYAKLVIEPLLKYEHNTHRINVFYGRIKSEHKGSLRFAKWANFKPMSQADGYTTVERRYG